MYNNSEFMAQVAKERMRVRRAEAKRHRLARSARKVSAPIPWDSQSLEHLPSTWDRVQALLASLNIASKPAADSSPMEAGRGAA
jgi:hypothetical protein